MIFIFNPKQDDLVETVQTYSATLYRLCFTMLCNAADAEDAVSDTLLRYMTKAPGFADAEHKKAWLLRTAMNVCKDKLRWSARHNHLPLDALAHIPVTDTQSEVLEAVLALPEKYRTVIYLHYMEGYSTADIAGMLRISGSAVRKRLQYARERLKLDIQEEST